MPKFQVPPAPALKEIRLGDDVPFGGLNLRDADTNVGTGQMTYGSKNINLDDGGKPGKRKGQRYLLETAVADPPVMGFYKELFNGKQIFTGTENLYSYDEETETLATLETGLSNAKGFFYVFNDVLYYKNGTEFLAIQTDFSVDTVASLAYIPTLTVATPPGGGGTVNEQRNITQPGFKVLYSGTIGTTAYTLSYTGLDVTLLTARKISGASWVNLVETTDFSVNRTTGVVTFNVAPGEGTNNVEITAYKTFGDANKINGCIYADLFGGGTNDSRIFLAGNEDYKNVYWYSGLTGNTDTDATYFPEFSFNRIGSDAKRISGWTKMYGRLIACKEDGIYSITYSNSGGTISFPVTILNSQIGCDMPGSIGIIKSFPVFAVSDRGLHMIVSTLIENEKNVEQLSILVNGGNADRPGILDESIEDLMDCSSANDGQKYYLCVGSKVWVWDYERVPYSGNQNNLMWYYYDNIDAQHWAYYGRNLYYGSRTAGNIAVFYNELNDFGYPIEGIWKGKLENMGLPDYYKTENEIWISTRDASESTIEVTYYNENGYQVALETTPIIPSFNWDNWDWDNFTWDVQRYATTIKLRPNLKKIVHSQLQFSNNVYNENLSLLAIVRQYFIEDRVR